MTIKHINGIAVNAARQLIAREKAASLKLQSFVRKYLARKQTEATKWVNNQKINPEDLLFKIAKKDINVPTNLSLHLVFKSLIEKGANINATNKYGWTPLHLASYKGNLKMAQLLIEKGADVNVKRNDGWSPLHSAVFYNYVPLIHFLIKHGADVNVKRNDGWSPLHSAVFHNYVPMAHLLIKHGADVNVKRNDGWSPLHSAVFHNYVPMAHLLITFNYLDKNDSMDFFTSDIENVTTEQIKDYYNTNKDQIDSLMKHRKESQLALSIVHTPHNVVLNPNLNEEKIITYSLALMKANKYLRYLPALCPFPVKLNSQWNFIMEGFQFFSLQDLANLAQVNKEFYNMFSTQTKLPSANNYLARLCNYLINHKNGIQILINANKNKLVS